MSYSRALLHSIRGLIQEGLSFGWKVPDSINKNSHYDWSAKTPEGIQIDTVADGYVDEGKQFIPSEYIKTMARFTASLDVCKATAKNLYGNGLKVEAESKDRIRYSRFEGRSGKASELPATSFYIELFMKDPNNPNDCYFAYNGFTYFRNENQEADLKKCFLQIEYMIEHLDSAYKEAKEKATQNQQNPDQKGQNQDSSQTQNKQKPSQNRRRVIRRPGRMRSNQNQSNESYANYISNMIHSVM